MNNTDRFIARSREIHGGKYDYSNVTYVNVHTPVELICPRHGSFLQTPNSHLSKRSGCKQCAAANRALSQRYTNDQFILKAKAVHDNKYDYVHTAYTNSNKKVTIVCEKHGPFSQYANKHLAGAGCPTCVVDSAASSKLLTPTQFIERAKSTHGDLYDYSLVHYTGSANKITIICRTHGPFVQRAGKHIAGTGCPTCNKSNIRQRNARVRSVNATQTIDLWKNNHPQHQYAITNNVIQVMCNQHGVTEHHKVGANSNVYPCRKCGIRDRSERLTIAPAEYITLAKMLHDGVYDYHVDGQRIFAICHKHGSFELSGNRKQNHIHRLSGCFDCKREAMSQKYSKSSSEFVEEASNLHSNKYTYSTQYKNMHTKIEIVCPEHGSFYQTPNNHLQGSGCPSCSASSAEQLVMQYLTTNNVEHVHEWSDHSCTSPDTNRQLRFDFWLCQYDVLIELDGKQHFAPVAFSNSMDSQVAFDRIRVLDSIKNKYADDNGYTLLRIPYTDFKRIPGILDQLMFELSDLKRP